MEEDEADELEEQSAVAAQELGGEVKLISFYVEEAIYEKMGPSRKGKVPLKKYDDFMATVLKGFGKKGVRCMRRLDLQKDVQEAYTHFAPSIYSKCILDSYRSNDRKWYRQIGNFLSLASSSKSSNAEDVGDLGAKQKALVASMLLEPYDQSSKNKEPAPALCVFQNAAVDVLGNVCTSTKKCLQAKTCNSDYGFYRRSGDRHEVVYSIAEFWGEGFFHFLCENFVRLFVGLDWLKSPGRGIATMIHIREKRPFAMQALRAVGIPSSRVLTGSVSAKAMIIPEPVGCGSPAKNLVELARVGVLSNVLSSFNQLSPQAPTQLALTVIQRTGSREVVNHQKLVDGLKKEYIGHSVQSFKSLSMKDSIKLFENTDILLGPHGAGLSNMLFMQPGRGVVEFMVSGRDVNACYMYLAIKLGLRYHTWGNPRASQTGKMVVDVEKILSIVSGMMVEMK
jgi:hypothetical protein